MKGTRQLLFYAIWQIMAGGLQGRSLMVIRAGNLFTSRFEEKSVIQLAVRNLQLRNEYLTVLHAVIPLQRLELVTKMAHSASDVLLIAYKTHTKLLDDIRLRFKSSIWVMVLDPKACSTDLRILTPIPVGQSALVEALKSWHTESIGEDQVLLFRKGRAVTRRIHRLGYVDHHCTLQDWARLQIRVGSLEMPPFVTSEREPDGTRRQWHGSNMDLFHSLMGNLHLRYSIVRPEAGTFGSTVIVNGTGEGLVGNAVTHLVDITVFPFAFERRYTPFLDIVWPTFYGRWGVVIPPPSIQYDIMSNTKPYQRDVWLVIVASTLAVACTMWVFAKVFNGTTDFGLDVLYSISLIAGQGGFNPKHLPGRMITTGWNLAAVIIVYTYTSILISFISAPVASPLIESLQDFVSKRTLKPVVNRQHVFATDFLEATSGIQKAMGDIYRSNPDTLVDFDSDAVAKVLRGGYAYITGRPMAEHAILNDFRAKHTCRMTLAKEEGLGLDIVGWYTSKHVPILTEKLKIKLMVAMEAGLITYFNELYIPRIPCFNPANLVPVVDVLTLSQLQTAFALLAIGIPLSAAAFLIERIRYRFAMSRIQNENLNFLS